ncbi:alpha/beta hydrolase [Nocardia sp. CDC159]|uniref:Alpha/beta hydrolase n=1 Tax=Nocardia pulmonis TaxID=2951408 RepID=A0A9X2E5G5_9NOCA|nr:MULTISPECIES: alpha/beta hydrolase [Nocardia]MCM6771961.1 alpha/beta hydrolase [Nocardia pulmonis]MCM6785381.1 alpha/beta hydrolase [Nocardia sp. CDC159]
MSTFVLVHGAGDSGWYWHLVATELRSRGHDVVAPDLPAGDDSLELADYVDAVVAAVGDRSGLVVVGQSFGAFTATLVAERLRAELLILIAGMVPAPGERPDDWWSATGYRQSAMDVGDTYELYYHDVPRDLADEALRRERDHPSAASGAAPWPLPHWPDVRTKFVLCTEDRLFPPDFLRRVVDERLGITPDEIAAGHCVALSRPAELADLFDRYVTDRADN